MNIYNTQKEKLKIREYGRNAQNMINHAKTIADKEQRTAYIEKIVQLIVSMYPNSKNMEDYKLKVWSHVLQIADFDLDIDTPNDLPDPRDKRRPDILSYPKKSKRMRHYGKNIKLMIDKAKTMEDPEKQKEFLEVIASFMKMSYSVWNRENVSDEVIAEEFLKISEGELALPDDLNYDRLNLPLRRKSNNNKKNNRGSKSSNRKNTKPKNQRNRNFSKNRNKRR